MDFIYPNLNDHKYLIWFKSFIPTKKTYMTYLLKKNSHRLIGLKRFYLSQLKLP
jgi:hypothetical protein